MFIKVSFFTFFIFFFITGSAQINEPVSNEVYNYLSRMAQMGRITWNDEVRPADRKMIFRALSELKANSNDLTRVERKELDFYLKDYSFDSTEFDLPRQSFIRYLNSNSESRYHTLLIQDKSEKLFLEPIFGVSYLRSGNRSRTLYFEGARVTGYFGKHFGMNFSFRDVTENGDTIDFAKNFTIEQGNVNTGQSAKKLNYAKLNFNAGYKWDKGSVTIGKDDLQWGYGVSSNIVLSAKAPSFPYVMLNFYPWKWVRFNYFHGWLQSDVIDSARSYNTGSGVAGSQRIIYRQKFIASHSAFITPFRGFEFGLGESMVYSDKINIGYLIPINFFKAYDHYTSDYTIEGGSNAQFFVLLSSRNNIKNTHLYAQLFVDEIKLSKIFNKQERRNQVGYTFGINTTDIFLNYLSAGLEYSRINPFVYNNLIPTQTYASHSYSLGDWMGNNADRIFAYLDYTPLPKLKLRAEFQKIRKGAPGNLQQQYNQQPQPDFLFQQLFTWREIAGNISYEWINCVKYFARLNQVKWVYPSAERSFFGMNFGFSYGL